MYIKYIRPFILLFACSLVLTSCLTGNEQQDTPSRFAVDLQLEGVSDELTVEEDALSITGVSFLQGHISLRSTAEDSTVLFPGIGVYSYEFPEAEYQRLLTGNLDPGSYESLLYNIEKAEAGDEEIPAVFLDGEEDDQRYSMIITGSYNDTDFEFKSTEPFDFEFDLGSTVDIPENNTTITLGVNFDVRQAFINADNTGILDPSDPDNAAQINNNIESVIELLPFE